MTAPQILSAGEIEALALKAARGAGMSWGLAEEAAFAVCWLGQQGLDSLSLLALHLDRTPGGTIGTAPVFQDGCWLSGGPLLLCPIAAGAALSDHFLLPQGPMTGMIRLCEVSAPLLVLPFLAAAGAKAGVVVTVRWSGCDVVLSMGKLLAVAGAEDLMSDTTTEMTVTAAPARQDIPPLPVVPPATLQALQAHVRRTYVPASEQSRRGAGADGIDDA